jgi:hypothetical protein
VVDSPASDRARIHLLPPLRKHPDGGLRETLRRDHVSADDQIVDRHAFE